MDLPLTSANYHHNYAFSEVLTYFARHRYAIIARLREGTLDREHFWNDRYCHSQYSSSQKCIACHLLGRVFREEELYQQCWAGFSYHGITYRLGYYRANHRVSRHYLARSIYQMYGPFNPPRREAPITDKLLCFDSFTLQAMISWILEELAIPHHRVELIYYCNNRGYRLTTVTRYLTYQQLRAIYSPAVIYRGISRQLTRYYHLLRSYHFYGGGLTVDKLLYQEVPTGDDPFTVHLNYLFFGEAALTYGEYRVCNEDSRYLVHRNPIHQVPAYQFRNNTLYYQLDHLRKEWHSLSQLAIVDSEPFELHYLTQDWLTRDPAMGEYLSLGDYIIHDYRGYLP